MGKWETWKVVSGNVQNNESIMDRRPKVDGFMGIWSSCLEWFNRFHFIKVDLHGVPCCLCVFEYIYVKTMEYISPSEILERNCIRYTLVLFAQVSLTRLYSSFEGHSSWDSSQIYKGNSANSVRINMIILLVCEHDINRNCNQFNGTTRVYSMCKLSIALCLYHDT